MIVIIIRRVEIKEEYLLLLHSKKGEGRKKQFIFQNVWQHVKANGGGDKSIDSDYDGEEEGTSNRGHPALSRQKKKNKN